MLDFNKISLKKIISFNETLVKTKLLKVSYIKQKYNKIASNYDETLFIYKKLNLVRIVKNEIQISKKFRSFLNKFKDNNFKIPILVEFLIDHMVFKQNYFSETINEFLSNFECENGDHKFKVKTSQKIKYSGIRNLLKELDFIIIDFDRDEFKISKKYAETYKGYKKRNKTSLLKLKKILKEKEEIGHYAELRIIEYEKERLSAFPLLLDKIEHVALNDVSAGYDIKSFKGKLYKNNDPILIYIEVKAVPFWEYEFKWTRNEINVAKLLKDRYILYLLPVKGYKDFDINNLKIINNPYKNVLKNKKAWLCTEEILSFSYIKCSSGPS